ncbi:nicotinamide-nucleotide amidase [Aequitasia blattaphilus]|uniref:Putative competence-damage inducible protein n=1 Tax=Aequitasia blattaphilus TaxID=2949332 RepID=A0ABT1E7G7_9FIRM|nr:competence/damage-inducible protein A [Aequitasia blattaphilus]MCP1101559.1 competence/damage-inducible protein A [Aequitasia blattaphilus]MCR8614199.1 competence/damage-inducible protein A [Aequitasia blattaphilus]
MVVELISVGTEILIGSIVNTNAAYLAEKCAALGLSCYHQSVVGDNRGRLEESVKVALNRSDIVILSGGLGPTEDDLTKDVVAQAMGLPMVEDAHSKERIQKYFDKIGAKDITSNNWRQAMIPEGSIVVDNHNGTAPGIIVEKDGKTAILLPGPPGEIRPMFERDIQVYLENLQELRFFSYMIKVTEIGESKAEMMIKDLIDKQTNPTIAPYAKIGEVHFRITTSAKNQEEATEIMRPTVEELFRRFGDKIFTTKEEETLEEVVVHLLEEKKYKIAAAESCTGGLFMGRLINVSGASNVVGESYITYSNEAKERLLGVSKETLEKHGAVSEETAMEMAIGAAKRAHADVGVGITGIAGPTGGTDEKPVGLIFIGCFIKGKTEVFRFQLRGNREKNRDNGVVKALTVLRQCLINGKE